MIGILEMFKHLTCEVLFLKAADDVPNYEGESGGCSGERLCWQ